MTSAKPLIQLIRHGESLANAGGVTRTPACIPLTVQGETQARELAVQFQTAPELIVVSPYIRTHQTAAPLRSRFPEIPVEEWPVHEFTYLNAEWYAGTTETQRAPAARDYWQRKCPHYCDGSGAESFANFIGRADALIHQLATRPERHISIFTHSFFIHAVQWRNLNLAAPVDEAFMKGYLKFREENPLPNAQVVPFAN